MSIVKKDDALQQYLFHFNGYNNTWSGFLREDNDKYFNGELEDSKVFKSKNIITLVKVMKNMLKLNMEVSS